MKAGGNLEIYNSKFYYISNLDEGPVVYGSQSNSITSIYDSSFYNNTALEGGVFHADSRALIK